MNESEATTVLHRVRDDIEVTPVDPMAVVAAGRRARSRRSRLRLAAGGVGVAALVIGAVVVNAQRPPATEPVGPPAPDSAPMLDGIPVVYGDTLYVDDRSFALDSPPLWVAAVPRGAVVSGEDGKVWLADASSDPATFEQIGAKFWESALVSDPKAGWAAWVDGLTKDNPDLVVYDTEVGEELGRWAVPTAGPYSGSLDAGTMPISISDGRVDVAALDGDYSWFPTVDEEDPYADGGPSLRFADGAHFADSNGGTSAYWSGDGVLHTFIHGPAGTAPTRRELQVGVGRVQVSPDGGLLSATSFVPGYREPALYDIETGERLATGLPQDALVFDAAFGTARTITYAVGRRSDPAPTDGPRPLAVGSPPFQLVTCTVDTAECTIVWTGPTKDTIPFDQFLLGD